MNTYLTDLKVDRVPKEIEDIKLREFKFSEEYFDYAKSCMDSFYQEMADAFIKDQADVVSKVICECFAYYLECKSGHDMYVILTTIQFVKYNYIVEFINERLKYSLCPFGDMFEVFQVGALSKPLEPSEELENKLVIEWERVMS